MIVRGFAAGLPVVGKAVPGESGSVNLLLTASGQHCERDFQIVDGAT